MVSVLASAGHKNGRRAKNLETNYAIEMLNITKRFPGIIANDNITLKLKKGEIHALLGENGAGKSTLMSVLFGLYQPEEGEIHKDGRKVEIRDPNDANELGIGMVHQHFKLVECFSVLDNIILGVEPNKMGFLQKQDARKRFSRCLRNTVCTSIPMQSLRISPSVCSSAPKFSKCSTATTRS